MSWQLRTTLLVLLPSCGFTAQTPSTVDGASASGSGSLDASVAPMVDARGCSTATFPLAFGTSRYRIGDGLSWFGSRDECVVRGGRLAIIESIEENTAVSQMLMTSPTPWTWIGLEKQASDVKTWVDGVLLLGTDFSTFNPSTGNPNDDCYDMNATLEKWGDWNCTTSHAYLCECDPMR